MPRRPRTNVVDGLYHVISRGVRRLPLFEDAIDYRRFSLLFGQVARDLNWTSHVRCQMPNHFHLILETPEPNLSAGMQRLNSRYAQWFNWRHGYTGHAFDRRFYSGMIESNAHLLEVARYVHLNPVRAGLCRHPREWPFSTYGEPLTLLLADQFGGDPEIARERYERFVYEGPRFRHVSGSDPRTRPDQPKPYVPAKRSARRRTRSAAGSPTTLR